MPRQPSEILPKDINKDRYHDEWQWQEGDLTVTRSVQWSGPGCHNGCSLLFYTKNGKLVDVEGDPNSPYNSGRLCMRCLALPEVVNHPDRLLYPLKRAGKRGENKWERITWDEAYDTIVENVRKISERRRSGIHRFHGGNRAQYHLANALPVLFGIQIAELWVRISKR